MPPSSYSWIKDDKILPGATESFYRISKLSRTDTGTYRCIANNSLGAIISRSCNITVACMDQFTSSPPITIQVSSGNSTTINLPSLNSVPSPSVDWKKGSQYMSPEGPRHQMTLYKNLILLDTQLGDNNTEYSASAVNGATGITSNSPVFVLRVSDSGSVIVPPSIVVPLENATVTQGSSVVKFECVVNARPLGALTTEWYKVSGGQRQVVVENHDKYIFSSRNYKRQLWIKNASPSDAGVYECDATLSTTDGQISTVSSSANLIVHTIPEITSQIKQEYEKTHRDDIEIECKARGNPAPKIHWYFNAEEITEPNSRNTRTLIENGTLIINSLDLADSGMYQCFARNAAGEAYKFAWIKVISKPPEIINKPSNLTIIENEDARLPCSVEGAPKPDVEWTRETGSGKEVIISGGRIQVLDNELLVATAIAADSGMYMCNATNNWGTVTAYAYLTVLVRTQINQPPQNMSVVKGANAVLLCGVNNDPDVVVTWKWYHNSPVRSEISVDTGRHTISTTGTLTISGVNNVDIGLYVCQVISQGGNDSRDAYLQVIELPHAPRISSVTLHTGDFRSVNVTWSQVFDGHSSLLRFIMQYRLVLGINMLPSEGWVDTQNSISGDAKSYIVERLRPARSYQFRVSAVNAVGEGPFSPPAPDSAIVMPDQAPSNPPRGLSGSPHSITSISLEWQAPEESSWNGILLGYVIKYRLTGYTDVQTRNTTDRIITKYILDNLTVFQDYDVQVAAYNSKGVGNFTRPLTVKTMAGTPAAPPRNVEVIPINSTCINVTWLPPEENFLNGIIAGYKIHILQQGNSQPVIQDVDPDLFGQQIKYLCALLKYTNYTISVLCFTRQGHGPLSGDITVRTNEDVPGQVGGLTFSNVRDRSLKVSWSIPEHVNGILKNYTVIWEKKNQSSTKQQVVLKPEFTSYTITPLSPSTKYTFYVYASTRIGPGSTRSADIESGVPPVLPEPPVNLGVSNILKRSILVQFFPGFDGKTSINEWIVVGQEGNDVTWKEIYRISDPDAKSIRVLNLRPFTRYVLRIIAVNIVGSSNPSSPTRSFQTLQAPPSVPPDDFRVRAVNATALRVSWTPLTKETWNGNSRGYKILYKLKEESVFGEVVLDMVKHSYILNGLQEWMTYEVKMAAYNDLGSSGYSQVTCERTRDAKPTAGPSNVIAVPVSSTSINVTWGDVPALEQNGMILGYKVQYASLKENILPQMQDVPGNTTKSVLIQGLRKYVEYQVQVLAYTRMGDGVLSQPRVSVKTTEDVPGPPVMICFPEVSFTTAKVVWHPPIEPNGRITGYMVSYKQRDGNAITNSSELNPSVQEYTVASLQRETYYVFMVKARTRLGWGATSSVLVYTLVTGREPDSPSKPTITSETQPQTVTISFQPGFDGYGPLRNYTVQYKSQVGVWTDTVYTVLPTSSSCTVTGLRPNTRYTFRVAATNDIGTSDFSPPSDEIKTLEDKPEGAPINVVAVPLTTSSVRVTWDQPPTATWNGDILGYIVQYRKVDMLSFAEKSIPYPQNVTTLDQLTKFVDYEIRIIAFNSVGNSPHSTPAIIYVGEAAPAAPPQNIQVTATNSTELFISWMPPSVETQNGALSGYKVTFWLTRDLLPQNGPPMIAREQQVLLTGLKIFSNYSVQVLAFNLAGEGPKSIIVYGRTMEGANCSAGYKRDASLQTCLPCPIGYYQDQNSENDCIQCPPQKTTENVGADSLSLCIYDCPKGTKRNIDDTGCEDCPRGYYQSLALQPTCKQCQGKTFTRNTRSTKQEDCEIYCDSGEELVNGVCVKCSIGYYKDNSIDVFHTCTMCNSSFITPNNGSTSESECNLANCTTLGEYRDNQTNTCKPCPIGSYNRIKWQDTCTQCTSGFTTQNPGSTSANDCRRDCESGYEVDNSNNCQACPRGSYRHKTSSWTCVQCQNGLTTSAAASTSSDACDVSPCPAGQKWTIGQQRCEPCPVGEYQPQAAQFACEKCPNGRYTNSTGTLQESDCLSYCTTNKHNCHIDARCEEGANTGFTCTCLSGFDGNGTYCIHQCDNGYCVNGDCIRFPVISCVCPSGFQGDRCEARQDEQSQQIKQTIIISSVSVAAFIMFIIILVVCWIVMQKRRKDKTRVPMGEIGMYDNQAYSGLRDPAVYESWKSQQYR